jgi:flagellar basal body-associated protein FliL
VSGISITVVSYEKLQYIIIVVVVVVVVVVVIIIIIYNCLNSSIDLPIRNYLNQVSYNSRRRHHHHHHHPYPSQF